MNTFSFWNAYEEQKQVIDNEKRKLRDFVFNHIRTCNHDTVYTRKHNPHGNQAFYTCIGCGLTIPAGITFRLDTELASIADADVVVKTDKTFETTYQLSEIQVDALKYPKRFSEHYLETLFEDSPWSVSEILSQNNGNYHVGKTVYQQYSDWYADVKKSPD